MSHRDHDDSESGPLSVTTRPASPASSINEPLMTARQVATYLQTSPRRVVDLWKAGHLNGFWLNPSGRRDARFRPSDVEAFLAARQNPYPEVLPESGA